MKHGVNCPRPSPGRVIPMKSAVPHIVVAKSEEFEARAGAEKASAQLKIVMQINCKILLYVYEHLDCGIQRKHQNIATR